MTAPATGIGQCAGFDLGLAAANEPPVVAQQDRRGDGTVMTNGSSPWHRRPCTTCGHTFRRGDRVVLDDAGVPRHVDPTLDCGAVGGSATTPARSDDARAAGARDSTMFSEGLLEEWPPGIAVEELRPDDPRVNTRPIGGRAAICMHCGHTFRPGEWVVVCPCRPPDRRCLTAIHRDPANGLTCWERWRPDGTVTICPMRQAKVDAARRR